MYTNSSINNNKHIKVKLALAGPGIGAPVAPNGRGYMIFYAQTLISLSFFLSNRLRIIF